MVFDPIAMTWRGNEEDLARFKSYTRPGLIPQMNPATQPIGNVTQQTNMNQLPLAVRMYR